MSQESPQRPGQATFAGWLIIGGSVILVVSAFQRIAALHTLEVQEQLQRVASDAPLGGSELTVEGLAETVRVLCMVAGGAAAAAAILGFYALRRSTSARLALSILAPLLLVGGFAASGFAGALTVSGIALLWLLPTRDWFAGRPWEQGPPRTLLGAPRPDRRERTSPERPDPFAAPPGQTGQPGPADESQHPGQRPSEQPAAGPTAGPASGTLPGPVVPGSVSPGRPADRADQASAGGYPPPNPYLSGPPRGAGGRPAALLWACVVVWCCTALVAGGLMLVSLAVAVGGDELWTEFERQQGPIEDFGVSRSQLETAVYALTAVAVPWAVAAAAIAVVAFLGRRWARVVLTVSSAVAGLLLMVMTVANPLLVVLVVACAVTVWLLLRPDVTAWRR